MTGKETALACLTGRESDHPAVINPTSVATAESCQRLGFSFEQAHLDADRMAALAAYGAEKLGFDSVMPYFSVSHEAAALGCTMDWGGPYDMPKRKNPPFAEPEEFTLPGDLLDRKPIKNRA